MTNARRDRPYGNFNFRVTFDGTLVPGTSGVMPKAGREDLALAGSARSACDRILRQSRRLKAASALFAGPKGTGKSLAAEVIAGELGTVLYRVDLSKVASKYIGETEKKLERIFAAAEAAGAVLFFSDVDVLFATRAPVRDSRNHYAHMAVGYLLMRLEGYRGVAILATNRKDNIDSAFLRRLRFIVNFTSAGTRR